MVTTKATSSFDHLATITIYHRKFIKLWKFIEESRWENWIKPQISQALGHSIDKWNRDSAYSPHSSHKSSTITCCWIELVFVGKISLAAFQTKCLTLLGTWNFHNFFPKGMHATTIWNRATHISFLHLQSNLISTPNWKKFHL